MTFGSKLRFFREQSIDLDTEKRLTQQKLGELIGQILGDHGYSAAAISDWELNKSKINADERRLLTSIVKILKDHNGIKTLDDANLLLESGNFRALNKQEIENLFPNHEAEIEPSLPPPESVNSKFLVQCFQFRP